MLQQTQVKTVIPYFQHWMKRWPTARALAQAPMTEVLQAWAGLGYYRRARLLHAGIRAVVERGVWPQTAQEWREIPGIGPYTAGAISSIGDGELTALVDGNVARVFSRLLRLRGHGPALLKQAWRHAEKWTRQLEGHPLSEEIGNLNQAWMELGSEVCRPVEKPACERCPISKYCQSYLRGVVSKFPNPKPPRELRHLQEWVEVRLRNGKEVFLVQNSAEEKWHAGLWDFPKTEEATFLWVENYAVTQHRISRKVILRHSPQAQKKRASPSGKWVKLTEDPRELSLTAPAKKIFLKVRELATEAGREWSGPQVE
jgi:A/G-specific adenine glycosylase